MDDEKLESLWRSLLSDGLGPVFERSFETNELSGLLAGLPAVASLGSGGPDLRSIVGLGREAETENQRVLPQLLQGVPLAGGLLRYFLGRETTESASVPPTRYQRPERIDLQANLPFTADLTEGAGSANTPSAPLGSSSPTVVIQVNAMDSMSILDRSDDIAKAVRQAMLTYQPFDDIWR